MATPVIFPMAKYSSLLRRILLGVGKKDVKRTALGLHDEMIMHIQNLFFCAALVAIVARHNR